MTALETGFYVTGGTVPGGAPSYVRRKADDELYDGLRRGEFCYVLTSRQMGKSSLMVRTATRLRENGISPIVLDLTAVGQNLNAEQWYEGLLNSIGQQLDIEDEVEEFWLKHKRLGPLQRWMLAIHEVVFARDERPIVIFIDEIDAVRGLPFSTDEFFAGIRELYNQRARTPELRRPTFCLLGVATPSDLIRDTRTTPFNIGHRIELHDFTEADAAPLAKGFHCDESRAPALLRRVLHWTGGHPYLTQRLCQTVAEDRGSDSTADVDRLCQELFFSARARERDDNLIFVRERILRSECDLAGLLELYSGVRGGKRVRDEENNPLINVLRLSGIVRVKNSRLAVRNRIYERVFDREWVRAQMPDAELKRQERAYRQGQLRAAMISGVIIALLLSSIFVTRGALNRARDEKRNARRLLYVAQMNLAQQSWKSNNIERVIELLENQKPGEVEEDLRGFEWYYLNTLCNSDAHTFPTDGEVRTVAFSPDGQTLAAGCDDYTVKMWRLSTRQETLTLKGHTQLINYVAFLPDSRTLATASDDNTVRLWDAATGRELARLEAHTDAVHSVVFSPLDRVLITGSEDGDVNLWDEPSRQWLAKFQAGIDPIRSMALSPDGNTLALGSRLGLVGVWDAGQRQQLFRFTANSGIAAVHALAFSPNGKILAAGNEDGTVKLWTLAGRQELATLRENGQAVLSLAFSPNGELLAAGNQDKTVTLWAMDRRQAHTVFRGHRGVVRSLGFSPDGKWLATGGQDRSVKLWNVYEPKNPMVLLSGIGKIHSVALSPDGQLIVAGGSESARVFSIGGGREVTRILEGAGAITALAFAPDGRMLATASEDETVRLFDCGNWREVKQIVKDAGEFYALEFSSDGKILAAGGQAQTIRLWDASSGAEKARLSGHNEIIRAIAFSRDGKTLASTSSSGVKLWDVSQQRELAQIKLPAVNCTAFSPDNRDLALASNDGTVRLWDWARNYERLSIKGHADVVWSLAFSPDGRRLASGSKDKTLKLWEVANGQELATYEEHSGDVTAVRFSTDGRILATGSNDGTIKLRAAASLPR
ncbi:MAG: AAA-like domain-containing protein [Blastocatellia bacterium]